MERIVVYKMEHDFIIGTVRFNNKTYLENIEWKQRKEHQGCAYGLDKPISKKIPSGKSIYIIEMNNDTNEILGIGKIKNQVVYSHRSRMYKEERLNKFIYKSPDFISRDDIIKKQPKGNIVLKFLENILFYGYKHFKRGQGCIIIPWDRILTVGNKKISYNKSNPKKCSICCKPLKGHICQSFKKNLLLEKFIHGWFMELV
tara:strand:+ start:720 stop:1322 length:603 start_codon:yes stop_codon:yes gene_type:complete